MTDVKNPRFSHTCIIYRTIVSDPMEDSDTSIPDDPMADTIQTEEVGTEDGTQEQPKRKVIYRGKCRSYNRDTVSGYGDVISSYRGLALPVEQDAWTEDTIPSEGDEIVVFRKGYKEYGVVTDRRPGNLGTHLIWKYARN